MGCGQPNIVDPVPTPPAPAPTPTPPPPAVVQTHQPRIATVKIQATDTAASLAQKYAGTVIVFDTDLGLAIIGTDNQNLPSDAVVETNAPLLSSPNLDAQGWSAWASGWGAWAGGWHAWAGGNAGVVPSVPEENRFRFSINHFNYALNVAKNLGAGIKVAVIDTGVDTSHPMFAGRLAPKEEWKDFVDADQNPSDTAGYAFGHGTGVAGLVVQLAPRATILPIRVLNGDGSGDILSVIAGIDWAVQKGAQVINLSLGAFDDVSALKTVVEYAASRGVYIVTSAGNQGASSITYPAAYAKGAQDSHIISVGSLGADSKITSFSNHSPELEWAIPGDAVYSAYPGNQIARYAGTSFSAPQMSGLLALGLGETDATNASKMQEYLQSASYFPLGIDHVTRETFQIVNATLFLQKPNTWLASKEVLMVVGSTPLAAGDAVVRSRLQWMGYKVTSVLAQAAPASDATGKALVMISSTAAEADVGTKFRDVTVPVMLWQEALYDEMGMTTSSEHGVAVAETQINLVNLSHPMSAGMTGQNQSLYSAANNVAWAQPQAAATIVATMASDPTKALAFVYEPGTQMLGLIAPARRVGCFLQDASAAQMAWAGTFLFDEAVNYAINGN